MFPCSWKLKDPSCGNEIKNTDVTIPDFHHEMWLQSSLQVWVQSNFLEANRVSPTFKLSQTSEQLWPFLIMIWSDSM